MRSSLFFLVAQINSFVFDLIRGIANLFIYLNGRIGFVILSFIDRDRMHHAEMASDQEDEISELNILLSIFSVRDDAIKTGKWHEEHEDKLNYLGNILANIHDWEVEDVQRYIYEVIETGPKVGME